MTTMEKVQQSKKDLVAKLIKDFFDKQHLVYEMSNINSLVDLAYKQGKIENLKSSVKAGLICF